MAGNVCVNQVFRDTRSDRRFRLLWMDPGSSSSYIYWIDGKGTVPKSMPLDELQTGVQNGWIEEEEDPYSQKAEASEEDKHYRDVLWDRMKEALLDEPGIYDKRIRSEHLKRIEKESGEQVANLYKRLGRYWERGKTPDAFLPSFKNRGGKGKPRIGRANEPKEDAEEFGKTLTLEDHAKFEAAIRKYYLTGKESDLTSVYNAMLKENYSVLVKREDGLETVKLLPKGQLPSLRQFRYWYSKNRDIQKEVKGRKGETGFETTARAVTGKNEHGMMGPGSQYQVDATVADIYLVSQFDRKDIIGRPVMYFVMDTVSRIVTGMYIGLEGPSWAGMMMALYNATTDKVDYCHKFGIEITEDMWPCHHVPAVLLGDRGELESYKADNLVSMLGIRVDNAPPYRGDLKPVIERHFRTIHEKVKPFAPGFVMPDDRQRGGKDYRLDAKLDIRQFTQMIIGCVLSYNTKHYMTSYEQNEQMLKSGVVPIPVKLWEWGIRNCAGALRTYPEETIRLALMPRDKGSITEKGVQFKRLYYTCRQAKENPWFETARKNGRYAVDVSYDPRDMGMIYVWDKKNGNAVSCTLLDWEQRFRSKSLEEVEYEQKKKNRQIKMHEREEKEAELNLSRMIEAIVAEAEKMAPSVSGMAKSERLSGIRENRKEEKEALRHEEAFTSGGSKENTGRTEESGKDTGASAADPFSMTEEEWQKLSPIERMLWEDVKGRRQADELDSES